MKRENVATTTMTTMPSGKQCCICYVVLRDDDAENADDEADRVDEYRLHLLNHLRAFRGKSACPQCAVHCGSYDRVVDHFMMVHGGVQKNVCRVDDCVRSFWTRKERTKHEKNHALI